MSCGSAMVPTLSARVDSNNTNAKDKKESETSTEDKVHLKRDLSVIHAIAINVVSSSIKISLN